MARPELVGVQPPFYRIDGDGVLARYEDFRAAFGRRFERVVIGYSYKTNYVPRLLQILHDAGAWAEVVSALEYTIARRVGVPPERIVFNGPNKPQEALEAALAEGSRVHLDSQEEVGVVTSFARRTGWSGAVGVRVNVPHPEGDGHRARSRFGHPVEALPEVRDRLADAGVELAGLHAHLSTRSRSLEAYAGVVRAVAEAAVTVGADGIRYLDTGGGFGVAPAGMPGLDFPTLSEYAEACWETLGAVDPELRTKELVIEPGISMVGDQVSYFAPVRAVKRIGGRDLAFLDASVHTVKPTRHRHLLPARVYGPGGEPKTGPERPYDLVGYTCMDDDYIGVDQELPELAVGDVVELGNVGAYTLVFKPPFIRPMPPVYLKQDGDLELVRSEETVDQMLAGYLWEAP